MDDNTTRGEFQLLLQKLYAAAKTVTDELDTLRDLEDELGAVKFWQLREWFPGSTDRLDVVGEVADGDVDSTTEGRLRVLLSMATGAQDVAVHGRRLSK